MFVTRGRHRSALRAALGRGAELVFPIVVSRVRAGVMLPVESVPGMRVPPATGRHDAAAGGGHQELIPFPAGSVAFKADELFPPVAPHPKHADGREEQQRYERAEGEEAAAHPLGFYRNRLLSVGKSWLGRLARGVCFEEKDLGGAPKPRFSGWRASRFDLSLVGRRQSLGYDGVVAALGHRPGVARRS